MARFKTTSTLSVRVDIGVLNPLTYLRLRYLIVTVQFAVLAVAHSISSLPLKVGIRGGLKVEEDGVSFLLPVNAVCFDYLRGVRGPSRVTWFRC
jgi:hypothetical protein